MKKQKNYDRFIGNSEELMNVIRLFSFEKENKAKNFQLTQRDCSDSCSDVCSQNCKWSNGLTASTTVNWFGGIIAR